ncbi:MAG: hypothetical protein ACSHYB_16050 [Roseibacillus sp.]
MTSSNSHHPFTALLAFATLLMTALSPAQNADPLVYTVGKTFETNSGTTLHDYILWQPGDAKTTFGKRFGIYAKAGDSTSPTPYNLLGVQTLQTSPSAIQALLKLGEKFDKDARFLPTRIVALNAEAQGDPAAMPALGSPEFPGGIDLGVAQKLAQIMTIAETDAEILQSLISLGRAHPGVQMAIGLGFSIKALDPSVTTYEVREVDGSDNDLRVIGRVTLDTNNPQMLLPSGKPEFLPHQFEAELQQVSASAKDHLNARLRWSTPNGLRTLLPHTYGFNLYRVPKANVIDPFLLTSETDVATADGVRVNTLPIPAGALMTPTQAANINYLPETFFYGDDGDVFVRLNDPQIPVEAPDIEFFDGDTFFYYVAPRDIAGHPGPLSPPTEITICDRLPCSAPVIVTVDNAFDLAGSDPAAETGQQNLKLTIRQLPNTDPANSASQYQVYRWHSATDWQTYGGDPTFNLIGSVAHISGEKYVTFEDDDASDLDTDYVAPSGGDPGSNGPDTGSPVVTSESDFAMGKTFWYTVRAVDTSACTPANLSGHSGPKFGVPRDRVGPPNPEGSLQTCFCIPRMNLTDEGLSIPRKDYDLADDLKRFVVRVIRYEDQSDKRTVFQKIKSFDLEVGVYAQGQQGTTFERTYARTVLFKSLEEFRDVIVPSNIPDGTTIRVRCRLGDGSVSDWREIPAFDKADGPDEIVRYGFRAWVELCCPVLISTNVLRTPEGQIDPKVLALLPPESGDPRCPSWIETFPGSAPPIFTPVRTNDEIVGVCGQVYLKGDCREVRVYRRVGSDGPFLLISRQSGKSALPAVYNWKESAPVLNNGSEGCYYAQTFDENGNSSPMVRIGCVTTQNEDLGVAMMTDPVNLAPSGGNAVVQLSWFCDPVGIDRFEVWVAAEGGQDPEVVSLNLTEQIASDDNLVLPVTNADGVEEELVFRSYRTDSIASGFGSAGEFSVVLSVPADKKLSYCIRPIGFPIPHPNTGELLTTSGDFSNIVSNMWTEPASGPQGVIPWPARPLPGLANVGVKVSKYVSGEGPYFALPLQGEQILKFKASTLILVGAAPAIPQQKDEAFDAFLPGNREPFSWLFGYRRQNTSISSGMDGISPLSSFVVYRYQVPSERYPSAQPNLVQVTPLMDRMAYQTTKINTEFGILDVFQTNDPFFVFHPYDNTSDQLTVPVAGIFSRDNNTFGTGLPVPNSASPPYLDVSATLFDRTQERDSTIWVRDTVPAVSGASYQYLLVAFDERGEIDRVIPTNVAKHN